MTIAHTATADVDVFDGVKVTSSDGRILFRDGDQVSQRRLGSQETEADVRCLRELLQDLRGREVLGTRSAVQQGNSDLPVFKGKYLRVLCFADDRVVSCDSACSDAEDGGTVIKAVSKELPGSECLAEVLGSFQDPDTRSG